MNILRLNAFHDIASPAPVTDGQLIAAIEEERLKRIKHRAGAHGMSRGRADAV
jgi:carbamoyltransferase